MHKIEIKFEANVTAEIVDHILTGAAEGGSNYWAEDFDYKRDADNLVIGATFIEYEDEDRSSHTVTLEQIAEAIRKIAAGESDVNKSTANDVLRGIVNYAGSDWDADTYDCILQIAVFGELVYG